MSDLKKRLPTTVFMLIFVFFIIKFLPIGYFSVVLFLLISLAAYELYKLVHPSLFSFTLVLVNGAIIGFSFIIKNFDFKWAILSTIISFGLFFLFRISRSEQLNTFIRDFGIHFLIIFYLYFPLFFILDIKKNWGSSYLFFLIAVIAIGDSGAYFVGSYIGKHKIYPIASPKKSLEGLIAAVVSAGVSGYFLLFIFPITKNKLQAFFSAAVIGLFSQLSDPIESLFKRAAGMKDSGNILPGHGGILDRLDSYIYCAPLFAIILKFLWK